MSRPVPVATAIAILSAAAAQGGWWSVLAGVGVLALAMLLLVLVQRAQELLRANGARRGPRAREVADLLIAVAAATRPGEGARSLLLEAQSMLDDMCADGASGRRLLLEALRFIPRLPTQRASRGRKDSAPPVIETLPEPAPRLVTLNYDRSVLQHLVALSDGGTDWADNLVVVDRHGRPVDNRFLWPLDQVSIDPSSVDERHLPSPALFRWVVQHGAADTEPE